MICPIRSGQLAQYGVSQTLRWPLSFLLHGCDETSCPKTPAWTASGKLAALLPVASDAQHPQRQQSARQKKLPGSWNPAHVQNVSSYSL
jgi:hypothetical protein